MICFTMDKTDLRLQAEVAHCGWYMTAIRNFNGFGVRFDGLSDETKEMFRKLGSVSLEPAVGKTTLEP